MKNCLHGCQNKEKTMRQVVKESIGTVYIGDVDIDKYYGVVIGKQKHKGFITRLDFDEGTFAVRCLDNITNGNGWDQFEADTLESCIDILIESNDEVFEFENERDLMYWLLRD